MFGASPLATLPLATKRADTRYPVSAAKELSAAQISEPVIFLEIVTIPRSAEVESRDEQYGGLLGYSPVAAMPLAASSTKSQTRKPITRLFSSAPWIGAPGDSTRANVRADPRLINAGSLLVSLPRKTDDARRTQRTVGDATISIADGALVDMRRKEIVKNATVKAFLGKPDADSNTWTLIYTATVKDFSENRKEMKLSLSTGIDRLERPFQLQTYTGTGNELGGPTVQGRKMPTGFGPVFNAKSVPIDPAFSIEAVHDGPIRGITDVREGGLSWQATVDVPTTEALKFVDLSPGQYASCREHGTYRWQAGPEGLQYPLRVDFDGDASDDGYVSNTGGILRRILLARAHYRPTEVDLNSLFLLPDGEISYYNDGSSSTTLEAVISRLLRGVAAVLGVDAFNRLTVKQLVPPKNQRPALKIGLGQYHEIKRIRQSEDTNSSQPISYSPNWSPLTDEQIAPGVDASFRERLKNQYATYDDVLDDDALELDPFATPANRLPTLFRNLSDGIGVAETALRLNGINNVPIEIDLGQRGLDTPPGSVIEIEDDHLGLSEFNAIIYRLQMNLGRNLGARVTGTGDDG